MTWIRACRGKQNVEFAVIQTMPPIPPPPLTSYEISASRFSSHLPFCKTGL